MIYLQEIKCLTSVSVYCLKGFGGRLAPLMKLVSLACCCPVSCLPFSFSLLSALGYQTEVSIISSSNFSLVPRDLCDTHFCDIIHFLLHNLKSWEPERAEAYRRPAGLPFYGLFRCFDSKSSRGSRMVVLRTVAKGNCGVYQSIIKWQYSVFRFFLTFLVIL